MYPEEEDKIDERLLGVIYLELIDEHGDGVELVVCVWRFSHGVSRGGRQSGRQAVERVKEAR